MKQGFTLIELMVVVLIVGILAAIAIPQYEAAIEKARISEALVNMKAIADAVQRYDQANPGGSISSFSNIADVDLRGGSKTSDTVFKTKLFIYELSNGSLDSGAVTAYRVEPNQTKENALYSLTLSYNGETRGCTSNEEDFATLCTFFQSM